MNPSNRQDPSPDPLEAERRAFVRGDPVAFGRLVELHATALRRLLLGVVGAADVDDVVQDAFVRAWERRDGYDPDRAFGPWLRRVAMNLAIDHVRRRRRANEETGEATLERLAVAPTAPREVEAHELREEILSGLSEMPADWAVVLRLRALEEMSYAEIANTLQIPMGTVMSRLSRARARLAARLAAHFGPRASKPEREESES